MVSGGAFFFFIIRFADYKVCTAPTCALEKKRNAGFIRQPVRIQILPY